MKVVNVLHLEESRSRNIGTTNKLILIITFGKLLKIFVKAAPFIWIAKNRNGQYFWEIFDLNVVTLLSLKVIFSLYYLEYK